MLIDFTEMELMAIRIAMEFAKSNNSKSKTSRGREIIDTIINKIDNGTKIEIR